MSLQKLCLENVKTVNLTKKGESIDDVTNFKSDRFLKNAFNKVIGAKQKLISVLLTSKKLSFKF